MERVRLADLLVGLSAVTDLGMGMPMGEAARTCLLACWLADEVHMPEPEVRSVFYTSLLLHVGCTAYSHEAARHFADELVVKRASLVTNFNKPSDVLFRYLPSITRGAPDGDRLRSLRSGLIHGRAITEGYARTNCEVGAGMARRLDLSADVETGLLHVFESWNGKGHPRRLRGEEIALPTRVAHVAGYAALFDRLGGTDAAVTAVRERSGGYLDPTVADRLCRTASTLLSRLDAVDVHQALLEVEPQPVLTIPTERIDKVLAAFGDVVDLKAPFFHGHATTVSRLTGSAAERLGLPKIEIDCARRAGLVADLGRAAVPNGVWERSGEFRDEDWTQVQLHPYYSERILSRSPALTNVASVAGAHHERLDGSGYYRRALAASLPMASRLLAAAEAFATKLEPRPHRKAMTPEDAAHALRAISPRKLDPVAIDAVLGAAGHATIRTPQPRPAGLTDRQVDVLRLLAAGLSNKQIARRLNLSPRTAEHHVQDIYTRLGVSSRAPAALFAMEHNLLGPASELAAPRTT